MNKEVIVSGKAIIKTYQECVAYKETINPKLWRKMDFLSRMAVVAARAALKNAGLDDKNMPKDKAGVILATAHGPTSSKKKFIEEVYRYGIDLASAFIFPNTVMNMPAGMISIELGIRGVNFTLVTTGNAFAEAVGYAELLVKTGKVELVLAGSVNESNDLTLMFDEKQNGAEIVVLESAEHARIRNK